MLNITEENRESSLHATSGFLLMSQGKYDEAIASFDKAINIIPNSSGALVGRACCKHFLFTKTDPNEWKHLYEDILVDLKSAVDGIENMLQEKT